MTYSTIQHHNSRRSIGVRQQINTRRRIAGLPERDFETDPLISHQIIRDRAEGIQPRRRHSPELLRQYRSRYEPHTGAKQLAKIARRR